MIVLIALILVAIIIVSSVTAPAAKAPTAPPTPGPIPTPTAPPVQTVVPELSPTAHKKKDISSHSPFIRVGQSAVSALLRRAAPEVGIAVVSPNGRDVVSFVVKGDPYARNPVVVRDRRSGSARVVGYGDPLVRPVWSSDSRVVVYARVASTGHLPGARWELVAANLSSRHSWILARANAIQLTPLGWHAGRFLYLLADEVNSTIYQVSHGKSSMLQIMMSQPLTAAVLAPGGRYIAWGAPVNCGACTLNIYDLDTLSSDTGPSSMPDQAALAWASPDEIAVPLGKRLALVSADGRVERQYSYPTDLGRAWTHTLRVSVTEDRLVLTDRVTGRSFVGRSAG